MKAHLLYVEDDESLSFVTRDNLALKGYQITHYSDGKEALQAVGRDKFDLCILDVMLPGVDGFSIAKEIRKFDREVPIIFLTAKSLKEDKIHGLKLGADDYLTKPFSIEELMLKIEIFLRRSNFSQAEKPESYKIGSFEFSLKNLQLDHEAGSKTLTQREADLLALLAQNKGEILKRSDILTRIWGDDDYFLGRSLDVFISRLRKYLKADPDVAIENIHGVGFRLKG
ncbi:MAG: response regulator transcription factor [Saprospiraceae bacterium]|nr:response regulator transcription factor [Saprospiraceae bacterium]